MAINFDLVFFKRDKRNPAQKRSAIPIELFPEVRAREKSIILVVEMTPWANGVSQTKIIS